MLVLKSDDEVTQGTDPDRTVSNCGGMVSAIGSLLAANSRSRRHENEVIVKGKNETLDEGDEVTKESEDLVSYSF